MNVACSIKEQKSNQWLSKRAWVIDVRRHESSLKWQQTTGGTMGTKIIKNMPRENKKSTAIVH